MYSLTSFAPVASAVGFLEAEISDVVNSFLAWQKVVHADRDIEIKHRLVYLQFPAILDILQPLTDLERRRYLFVPTASRWTAYFDNGIHGSDVFSTVSFLSERLGVTGVRSEAFPCPDREEAFDALVFEVYGAQPESFLNIVRSVSLVKEDSKCVFNADGRLLPFEQPECYRRRRASDRFTFSMLVEYLAALEIAAFEADYYVCGRDTPAVLVEKIGPMLPRTREYSLEESRKLMRLS